MSNLESEGTAVNRNAYILWFLIFALVALTACSGPPAGQEAKKAAVALQKIQGRAQINKDITAADAALNAGGPSVFIWEGVRRYRLFLKTPAEVEPGKYYIAEGIYAQQAIDEIGDPALGKNGYPLASSCDRVVRMAWPGMSFDAADSHSSALRAIVKRYPARGVFLVTKLTPTEPTAADKKQKEEEEADIKEVTVPAAKQKALLISGPTVQTAPLWEPEGGTVSCKVIINKEGKISELETGVQLCVAVPWSEFRYQPPVQGGKPVHVKTEVEVRFEPRKT
jgi:hypothetical protein